ncbi:hypothetical protein GLOTRDRAFT_55221 [Gloeophyllum trabeum ATCC 11539]|uniref:Nucleoporin Nup82 n=1 Tax=Gloeophyllum trabeum (strain ATCC 11539 / FP-39264 / Madison 617) TaxID=670483 RepID=S7QHR1_GLOTA|nr:uncharacterized protein GLOTRDRAFT_55221 [Gloeophyllum trabeum ATCC 11539]EPQ59331.1 hypothetical protein GLOTRDRAFT_55221 [Gloeophyllum trabeum ATCC 11539]
MHGDEDWTTILSDHPIFEPKDEPKTTAKDRMSMLELSTSSLTDLTRPTREDGTHAPSGRRQVMAIRDSDLIVAVGDEIRITSLGESKLHPTAMKSYKTLYTPNIQFEIRQVAVNPNGKLLAVAGAYQIAVVVLPKPGFSKLVSSTVDCKSIQVGQFYHASSTSIPLAKIEWHPWGDAGSTLLVMTVDGKLREYDVSVDPEEPQQVLSFVPENRRKSYMAQDESEFEVASFTLGKGRGDWGPLTVYALTKSGDVYAISPYMPINSTIPSAYIHTLECFVAAKQEYLTQDESPESRTFSAVYDYQRKYVNALLKQLPPGTAFPAESRPVPMHPPNTIKFKPVRQGPFLMQPAPRELEGSEGGQATDISYLTFETCEDSGEGETERLGIVTIAYQDGRVDVCLDVEKIEAKWETRQRGERDLPMLAVYETVDLGLVSALSKISQEEGEPSTLELLQANHPVLLTDPIHEDAVYVYHAFGLHALHLGSLLQSLTQAIQRDNDDTPDSLDAALRKAEATLVRPILSTFSVERKSSNPVIAVVIPDDVYFTYSIFILTSAMRIISFPLALELDSPPPSRTEKPLAIEGPEDPAGSTTPEGPPAYVSLLGAQPFVPPSVLSNFSGLPSSPHLALPSEQKSEFMITPDSLRYLGTTVERFMAQIREVKLAQKCAESRHVLQIQEYQRQQEKLQELGNLVDKLKGARHAAVIDKVKALQATQKTLFTRLDRTLQAMMQKVSPELSQHERKWFEELKRMKEEVVGASRYDEESLSQRIKMLQREYDRLLPSLKELQRREAERKRREAEKNQGLGLSQAFELGERSSEERARISALEEEILQLSSRLDVALGPPPPLKS